MLGEIIYFFDEDFKLSEEAKSELKSIPQSKEIVTAYIPMFDENDSKEEWFAIMQNLASQFNYAQNAKMFKENPEQYNGDISQVVKIFRILLTGKTQTPDLSEIQHTMGKERVLNRLKEIENI